MATAKHTSDKLSIATYLAGENDGQWRHEFVDGRIYAMAGASERHNSVKLNVAGTLNAVVGDPCRVFDGDMKLRIDQPGDVRFYYPDVFVSCATDNENAYVRGDAVLVVEVLSPSTERTDRYEKFAAYTSLPMLSDYALIEQAFARVEMFRRRTGWRLETFEAGSSVTFESIGQTMTLDQIYRRVTF